MRFRPPRIVLVLLVAALAGATACGGVPTELDDTGSPVLAGGGAVAERDPALLGLWYRRALATDGLGNVFSIETIWSFQEDGTVRRRLITYDMFSDVTDELVATGTWTTSGSSASNAGTVSIEFTSPAATLLRLAYQLAVDARGTVLVLDGIPYQRGFR